MSSGLACNLCGLAVTRPAFEAARAYHVSCLRVLNAMRDKIRSAAERARRAERESARDRSDAATTRVRNMELDTELVRMTLHAKQLEQTVRELREAVTREQQNNRHDREEREAAVRANANLTAENNALRNELQSYRALAGKAPTPIPDPVVKAPAADDGKDPAVIRASLIELD